MLSLTESGVAVLMTVLFSLLGAASLAAFMYVVIHMVRTRFSKREDD